MTSPSPLLFDTYYHVYNRGNNRENIFLEEKNYEHFFQLYTHYIEPVAETFAYCLLRNHFHLLIRTRTEEECHGRCDTLKVSETFRVSHLISNQFSRFFNAYAKAINSEYGRTGSLFQHPFGRVLISDDCQFWGVIAYIHQNPQKHKFVNDFREWKWSSFSSMISDKPTRLQRQQVLEWFGDTQHYQDLHADWVNDAESKWFVEEDDD